MGESESSSKDFDWVDTADWWCLDGAPIEMVPATSTGKRGRPAKAEQTTEELSKPAIISRNIRWHCDRLGIKNSNKLRDRLVEVFRSEAAYSPSHVSRAYSGRDRVNSLDQFYAVFGIPNTIPLDAEDHIERASEYIAKPASEAAKKAVRSKFSQVLEHATVLDVSKIEQFLDSIS